MHRAVRQQGIGKDRRWRLPADYEPLPVEPPRTDLLRSEWKRHGLIDWRECPGPLW